jgi:4-hydroxybenzoate polyprenyltransferase
VTATAGAAAVAVGTALRGRPRAAARPARRLAGAAVAAGGYAATVGRAQAGAVRRPGDAGVVRRATGAGVRGVLALQSALLAAAGAPAAAAAVAAAGPPARLASRAVSPT